MDVTWSGDDVLVSISICPILSTYPVCIEFVACLVHHSQWDVSSEFVSLNQLGKITRETQHGVKSTMRKGAGLCWHLRWRHLWESLRGNVGSLEWRSPSGTFNAGSFDWCFGAQRVNWLNQRQVNHSRGSLLGVSMQWVSSEVNRLPKFWSPPVQTLFAMDNFQPVCGFGRTSNDWFYCFSAAKRWKRDWRLDVILPRFEESHIDKWFGLASFCNLVANIIGVWPLIVSYLKETARKDDGDDLVVRSSSFNCISVSPYPCII